MIMMTKHITESTSSWMGGFSIACKRATTRKEHDNLACRSNRCYAPRLRKPTVIMIYVMDVHVHDRNKLDLTMYECPG